MQSHKLPTKLLQIRETLGLTQPELLHRLGFQDELIQQNISSYEKGRNDPPLPVLLAYAKLSGVWIDHLVDDSLDLPKKLPARLRNQLK